MSLKDDFLEALRSVKRDFFKDYNPDEPEAAPASEVPATAQAPEPPEAAAPSESAPSDDVAAFVDSIVTDGVPARERAAALEDPLPELEMRAEDEDDLDEESIAPDVDPTPFRTADSVNLSMSPGGYEPIPEGRVVFDEFDSEDIDSGERTVISKNTVIKGAIQTEDSMRMFGQILGDIECKSNVLVAGKVRGNTSAANAYVVGAQVDGNLLCDDVINVTDDAWILGNIRAQQAEIDGKIKGNLEIRHGISVGSNSSIIGNISTDELEIKRGAFINGQIMMYSPSRDVLDRFDQFDQ